MAVRRGRRKQAQRRAAAKGNVQAAQRLALQQKIQAAGPGGTGAPRRRRGRRLDVGRPRHRLYPQRRLAAQQAMGIVPIPTVVGGVVDDDDGTE